MQKFMLKMNKVDEGGVSGGGAPAAPKSEEKPNPAPNDPKAEAQGDKKFDDNGYEITPPEGDSPKKGAEPEKKADEPKTSEKVETPATGYGAEPPKVEDPPPEKKVEAEVKPEPDELDPVVEGLPKDEAEGMKEFAKKHNIPKDGLKAFAELRKEEIKAAEKWAADEAKRVENAKIQIRAEWHKELKEDPDFGGSKFDQSLLRAEKVLHDFLPSTKKMLTESKGILPPYVMRDLAKLHAHLYGGEKLVQGEPKSKEAPDDKKDDALDFYNS